MYFSGTGTTKKMVTHIASGLAEKMGYEYEAFDFTPPASRNEPKVYGKDEQHNVTHCLCEFQRQEERQKSDYDTEHSAAYNGILKRRIRNQLSRIHQAVNSVGNCLNSKQNDNRLNALARNNEQQ